MKRERHVILLHGLCRTKRSMSILAYTLKREGYNVHNIGYHSRTQDIDGLVDSVVTKLKELCPQGSKLYGIGHSLGGIILRKLVASTGTFYEWNKLVLLGTPNRGARIARFISQVPLLKNFFGPALRDIACASWDSSLQQSYSECKIAVIAGGTGYRWGFMPFLQGDNDGIVRVDETFLSDCVFHKVITTPHFALMFHPKAISLCRTFFDGSSPE